MAAAAARTTKSRPLVSRSSKSSRSLNRLANQRVVPCASPPISPSHVQCVSHRSSRSADLARCRSDLHLAKSARRRSRAKFAKRAQLQRSQSLVQRAQRIHHQRNARFAPLQSPRKSLSALHLHHRHRHRRRAVEEDDKARRPVPTTATIAATIAVRAASSADAHSPSAPLLSSSTSTPLATAKNCATSSSR